MKYTFKHEVARRCMILISKHFIKRKIMKVDEFWKILAVVSKDMKKGGSK